MSTAEEDISALLDEMEMENYVSFLQEDSVFQELSKLDLPAQEDDNRLVSTEPMEFHDALDYFYDNSSLESQQTHISTTCMYPAMYPNQLLSDQVLHDLLNTSTTSTNDYPISEDDGCGLTTHHGSHDLLTCVRHDHTYADSTAATMLTTPISSSTPPSSSLLSLNDNSKGGATDSDEGSTSDTGYDTTGTSPGSTRSSFSSIKEQSPNEASPTHSEATPPHQQHQPIDNNLSKLLVDPVKLIDDRIKFFMNHQEVHLTEEEKDTLRSEGLPIPTTLPLTKTEEKALKGVRRRIRNKIAAQESRKKKKQYVHCLEEKVQQCTQENRLLHKKVHSLETENKTLLQQLTQLQLLVARATPILGKQVNTGTCLMVVVLCFGVLFGNLIPYRVSVDSTSTYTTTAVRSRSLLSMDSSSQWWLKWPGSSYLDLLLSGYTSHGGHYQQTTPTYPINTLYYSNNVTLCSS